MVRRAEARGFRPQPDPQRAFRSRTTDMRRIAMKRLLSRSVLFSLVFCSQLLLSQAAIADARNRFSIRTLSTWPDRVSGGDVLVEVAYPEGQSASSLIISLN